MTENQTKDHLTLIKSVEDLHYYLIQGMKIEHATLPPYLTALYSLKPGTNLEAFQILRSVAVEEMLHLTLVANVFNAVGGNIKNTLTGKDFIPHYPTFLPTGETDFQVGLNKFSKETLETFMKIERVDDIPEDKPLVVSRKTQTKINKLLTIAGRDDTYSFYSIGQFYAEIIRGLFDLKKKMGEDKLFCGDPKRQITPAYYYNGAGDIIPVTDFRSANRALKVIQEQGEGSRVGTIYDAEKEICHYYRFEQLILGRYYKIDKENPEKSDKAGHPTGAYLNKELLDWDAVYPIKPNAKLSDFANIPELYEPAKTFQSAYSEFITKIEHAFDGHPEELIPAVGGMFQLKYQAERLVKNPIPSDSEGFHGAPVFRPD